MHDIEWDLGNNWFRQQGPANRSFTRDVIETQKTQSRFSKSFSTATRAGAYQRGRISASGGVRLIIQRGIMTCNEMLDDEPRCLGRGPTPSPRGSKPTSTAKGIPKARRKEGNINNGLLTEVRQMSAAAGRMVQFRTQSFMIRLGFQSTLDGLYQAQSRLVSHKLLDNTTRAYKDNGSISEKGFMEQHRVDG
ncbi:hypothetical protein C8R44DRAFT_729833 [Mycena epipterygia]|nr:hypothetical protein C8R44DRAFT_729833 [Mycena epipterygia]